MKRAIALGALVALVGVTGCGGPKVVPVSGVVKINGEPYANAIVTFQPVAGKGQDAAGRGSSARTDKDGKFTLVYDGDKPGALVGKHHVRICTDVGQGIPDTEGDPDAAVALAKSRKGKVQLIEPIPAEWHDQSTKSFEVPRGGTTEANFDIDSPLMRKAKKK
jgi:hypothetical protein